ncbi:CsbD family protein [soil metagenome]
MADHSDSGPKSGVKGVIEGVKGKAKEAAGVVTGNTSLEREGEAQQNKADAQREVAEQEAKAEGSRAEAQAHEAEQKAAEKGK